MALVLKYGLIRPNTLGNISKAKRKEKENLFGAMVLLMRETLKIIT
jgi:hypothetical protein